MSRSSRSPSKHLPETETEAARGSALTYAGIFVLALATLMLEVLLTRITSVMAWYHLAFFVISLAMLGLPAMRPFQDAAVSARIAVSLGILLLPSLAMGLCFPLGLRLCEQMESARTGAAPRLGSWLWGINGAFGVCASGLALACSIVWGVPVTLGIGAACYFLLLLATRRLAGSA